MTRIWEVLFSRDASARLLTDFVECIGDAAAPASRIARGASSRARGARETAERVEHDLVGRLALFQVARSMRPEVQRTLGTDAADPRSHCVWVGGARSLAAVVEPLAHLLAASIASQFDECAVVVVLRGTTAHVTRYHRDDAHEVCAPHGAPTESAVVALLARDPALPPFRHVLYVRPEAPAEPPQELGAQAFDRVAYLDTALPRELPSSLETRLKEAARNPEHPSEPLFCSFVPSIVGTRWPAHDGDRGFAIWDHALRAPGWRKIRDACRLDLDPVAVAREWERWERSGRTLPFHVHADRWLPEVAPPIDRWARAVTNRQVGVALSGGGASSYRFVEPLRRFAAPDGDARGTRPRPALPIDVLSGVSGGTLLGAYFAAEGAAGLERALADGWLLQGAVAGFMARSQLVEQVVRWRVGDGSLAELPLRFVPVAVGLPAARPPETRVLTHFRLGEAVRASGALPVGFGQTSIRGERYADGGFGALLPAQVLKDYGADFVVGLNGIPGPAAGDPVYGSTVVDLVRRFTPLGRVIDLWVALAYLIQESSQLAGQVPFVHELVEPSPTSVPLVELVQFAWARDIAASAAADATFMGGVERCIELWRDFRSWDVPGAGWSVAASSGSGTVAPERGDCEQIEGGEMPDPHEITEILTHEDLERLKCAYSRETVVAILRDVTPRKYKVAQRYFSAVTDTFYPLADVPGVGEFRAALGIADRQRCILALQAGAGQQAPLAIHIYVSLMEGISPAEIANILLLAGVYTGVPNFFAGLEVLEETLELLAAKARAGVVEPLPVLLAVQAAFGPRAGAPAPPAPPPAPAEAALAPRRRLRSV